MKPMEAIVYRLENLEGKTKRLQRDMEHIKSENSILKQQNERLKKNVVIVEVEEKKEDAISSGWYFW